VALIIEWIDLGCASNLMRVLISLTAPGSALDDFRNAHSVDIAMMLESEREPHDKTLPISLPQE